MAGKKQHFIPQHYLKSFIVSGKGDHLWVYRRGHASAKCVARHDAAAQNYFYSRPSVDGSTTLDDLVTEYESDLHLKVDEIRNLEIGELIESAKISEIVVHLMIRSSHVRETMHEAVVTITNSVRDLFVCGPEEFISKFPRHGPSESIYRMLSQELANLGLTDATPFTEKTIIDVLYVMIREKGSDVLDDVLPNVAEVLQGYVSEGMKLSQRTQANVLAETMAPQERIADLSNLIWHVMPGPAEGAILPDCTSIAFNGLDWQPLLLSGSEELKAVVLALSPDRVAVGRATADLDLDLSWYNKNAADASYSFYIANRNSADLTKLIRKLGGKIRSLFKNLGANAANEALAQIVGDANEQKSMKKKSQAANIPWNSIISEKRHEYFVSLADFGDEEFAKSVANMINSIVVAFSEYYPISSLEGFDFAIDYKAALNMNNRGIDSVKEINPTESDEYIGVGMPLAVVSDGQYKTRIVFRASVAIDLVSDDPAVEENAQSVILHMLASCALSGLIAAKFPDQILKPVPDQFEAFLHEYSAGLFEVFFCASLSTGSQEKVEQLEKLALMALKKAFDGILEKRMEYLRGGDIEAFFDEAAKLSEIALSFLARMFGAYKGLNLPILRTSTVMSYLAEKGLAEWAELFNADLAGFEAGLEEWAEFEEMFFVHRHFQRFLAHFGIVPDRHDGDGAYVHVPWIASDLKVLSES